MLNSAKSRRDHRSRRLSSFPTRYALDAARRASARLVHLMGMRELFHPVPGLESVLTTSELAAHLGVPVETMTMLGEPRRRCRGTHGDGVRAGCSKGSVATALLLPCSGNSNIPLPAESPIYRNGSLVMATGDAPSSDEVARFVVASVRERLPRAWKVAESFASNQGS